MKRIISILLITVLTVIVPCVKKPEIDILPIVINGIKVDVTRTTADIFFTTSIPALGTVVVNNNSFAVSGISHKVHVENLTPEKTYAFTINFVDAGITDVYHLLTTYTGYFITSKYLSLSLFNLVRKNLLVFRYV